MAINSLAVSFTDINECQETPLICGRGNCTNYGGGHFCKCHDGFRPNGGTCAGNIVHNI